MVSGLERKYVGLLRTEKQISNDSIEMLFDFYKWYIGSYSGKILNSTLQLLSHKYTVKFQTLNQKRIMGKGKTRRTRSTAFYPSRLLLWVAQQEVDSMSMYRFPCCSVTDDF